MPQEKDLRQHARFLTRCHIYISIYIYLSVMRILTARSRILYSFGNLLIKDSGEIASGIYQTKDPNSFLTFLRQDKNTIALESFDGQDRSPLRALFVKSRGLPIIGCLPKSIEDDSSEDIKRSAISMSSSAKKTNNSSASLELLASFDREVHLLDVFLRSAPF